VSRRPTRCASRKAHELSYVQLGGLLRSIRPTAVLKAEPWRYAGDNANPRTRHFHAEVTGSGGPYGRSGQVSVEIQRFTFAVSLSSDKAAVTAVSLSSDKAAVTVPASFTLTATLDRDVGPTPYSVSVIDDDTGNSVGGCGSGTTCAVSVATSYAGDNANPRTRHFTPR
jgi:hypothetical protein